MKRRFNFTGRRKIPREKISIILNRDGDSVWLSDVSIDLNGMNLPSDGKVYVDAYHRTEIRRYNFGTVNNIKCPTDTGLSALAYSENLKFRVLVVDESAQHGLILAQADRIKLAVDMDRKSILPVDFRDLYHQIWKVEYGGDEGAPILVLNSTIPNIGNIAKSDPQFIMYVYPTVIREVLTHMVFVDNVDSISDPSVDWHRDWLNFARRILNGKGSPEILSPQEESFESDEVVKWIYEVVEEFCASRNEWREYINSLSGGER